MHAYSGDGSCLAELAHPSSCVGGLAADDAVAVGVPSQLERASSWQQQARS